MEVQDEVRRLSKKLQVKPLQGDEKAVFKLLSVGTKEGSRENPSAAEIYQMSAREIVMDPFDEDGAKRKVIATSVIGTKFQNGRTVNVYEDPKFIRGYCVVHSDNPEMFERLMRSKHCVSNKFRKAMGKGKDLFMLVEESKEVVNQLHLADLRWMAETIVRQGDHLLMESIASALNQSPDSKLHINSYNPAINKRDLQGMKLELINKATTYPKHVISASNDEKAKLKVQIFEAMNFGVLIFENKAYHLISDKDLIEVHKPDADKNPVDSLMEYFMSDEGTKNYVRFSQLLKKALNPKA